MKRALMGLLLAAGCAGAEWETPDLPDVKPGDNAVIKAAWEAWGMRGYDRPAIRYVEGESLNCETGREFPGARGFLMNVTPAGTFWAQPGGPWTMCALGIAWEGEAAASVAWDGDGKGVTLFAIVHELCHFANTNDLNHQFECRPGADSPIATIAAEMRARFYP